MLIGEIKNYLTYPTSQLAGKRALVTGASAGIGLATACRLVLSGVDVVLLARRKEKLEEIQRILQERFPDRKIDIFPGDVTDISLCDRLVESGFFEVDILINNAGLALGTSPVASARTEDWQSMIDTNITAAFRFMRYAVPAMIDRGGGHIINLASIAGHATYEGGSVYCATKHALIAFTKCLRQEVCDKNIRVSLVSPGMVKTEFSKVRFAGDLVRAEKVYEGMKPLHAEDIAEQVIFCLKQPAHVNLDEIIVMPTVQGAATKVHRKS